MSSDLLSMETHRPERPSGLRARQVVLVIALLFVTIQWTGLAWLLDDPRLLVLSLGGVIAGLPLAIFIVVTLARPALTHRAYWFLPLYFLSTALGGGIQAVARPWAEHELPSVLVTSALLIAILPGALLAGAL